MLQHYQNQACPELAALLEDTQITYSVLHGILQGSCTDIFTDHENCIVCYSAPPWPVWVWCRDPGQAEDVLEIARCLKAQFPLEQGYDINLSRELLDALKQADPCFQNVEIRMGLLSHRLDRIEPLNHSCEGTMGLVREEEIPGLVKIWQDMHREMEDREFTLEHCEESIRRKVAEKALFAWRDAGGRIVALTRRADQAPYSKITSVYTLPAHRRKGYAINLVHRVTESMLNDGLIPILYTDAGYEASNACYRKIGYRQVGSLVNICKKTT